MAERFVWLTEYLGLMAILVILNLFSQVRILMGGRSKH